MTSTFGRGVAVLATDCDTTWETFHFSEGGDIIRRLYAHGGKAWEDFMKLVKSAEQRQRQYLPAAKLATIKDVEGEGDEQDLDGFDVPDCEKKRQKARQKESE